MTRQRIFDLLRTSGLVALLAFACASGSPVSVAQDLDEVAARTPRDPSQTAHYISQSLTISPGAIIGIVRVAEELPEGQRFVIEHTSVRCHTPHDSPMVSAGIEAMRAGEPSPRSAGRFEIPIEFRARSRTVDTYIGAIGTRIYSDVGVRASMFRRNLSDGTSTCHFSLSGYLVPNPEHSDLATDSLANSEPLELPRSEFLFLDEREVSAGTPINFVEDQQAP